MNAHVERVNPEGLDAHPAFTNVVTVTVVAVVSALARPDALLELEAVAVVPE